MCEDLLGHYRDGWVIKKDQQVHIHLRDERKLEKKDSTLPETLVLP